jgi:hypothetical protein
VQSVQAESPEKAVAMHRYADDVVRNRRQGNLEIERLVNLPNYEKTKDALFGYLESAANRIAQVQTFGPKDEKALELIADIDKNGYDAQVARELFDSAAGAKKYGEKATQVSRLVRRFNSVTKLGTGAITNVGQNVNTATVVGGLRTLLNAPKAAFSQEAKDFALKASITLDGVLQDLREGGGFSTKSLKTKTHYRPMSLTKWPVVRRDLIPLRNSIARSQHGQAKTMLRQQHGQQRKDPQQHAAP